MPSYAFGGGNSPLVTPLSIPEYRYRLAQGGGGELAGGGDSRKKSVALRASRAEACTVRGLPPLITGSRIESNGIPSIVFSSYEWEFHMERLSSKFRGKHRCTILFRRLTRRLEKIWRSRSH